MSKHRSFDDCTNDILNDINNTTPINTTPINTIPVDIPASQSYCARDIQGVPIKIIQQSTYIPRDIQYQSNTLWTPPPPVKRSFFHRKHKSHGGAGTVPLPTPCQLCCMLPLLILTCGCCCNCCGLLK